jgi:predicted ATPase/DNA-binding winged helix-turn-helix (wHTH) protein
MSSGWLFNEVEIRAGERRVLRAGEPQLLGARAFDLLLVLVEQRGRVVSKDELMRRVWPGLVVEDNNLTVQISALRKAIGPAAISTVPGRGYQFTTDLLEAEPAASVPAGNLPAQTTRVLGRDADLAAVLAALDATRLLTLTGVGGIGKTRLALHAAAVAARHFPDGAWLIELASLSDPSTVGHAVAGALRVPQQPGKTIEQSLVEALAGRRLLLLLDNCEHLIDAVAALAHTLLAGCAQLMLLATSREALQVAGEQTWPVPALSVRDGDTSPAVELFVERARAVAAGFVLGEQGTTVAEICRQLDGIPLAIELAAARVRALSPTQIRARLDQRFGLLTGGPRDAQPRHQTLRHAVQWSFDLLSPPERSVLSRAAVFAGGFTLAAAERVCSGTELPAGDVLDRLDSLVRKSLLNADQSAAVAHYGMLETIRQFGEERLIEGGQLAATRHAHARWVADDSDAQFALWRSPRQREAYEWLDREMGNLRMAFRWAMEQAEVDVAARIASNIGDMARHRLRDETAGWAAEIVDAARRVRHRRLCVLLNWAGSSACAASRFDEARRYGEEAVALADDPDFDPLVLAYVDLAYAAMADGDVERALGLLRSGAAHPADRHDRYCAACLLAFTAAAGRIDEARQLADTIVPSVDAAGVPCSIVVAHAGKAGAWVDADPAAALAAMAYAIETARTSGCRFLEIFFTPKLAVMQACHGDPLAALHCLERMWTAWNHSTDAAVIADWRGSLVVVLNRLGLHEEAATLHATLDGAMQGTALVAQLDDAVQCSRDAMDEATCRRATRHGAALTPHQADDFALARIRAVLAARSAPGRTA